MLKAVAREITKKAREDWNATIGHQRPKNPVPARIVIKVRHRNTIYLKKVVNKIGWPTAKLVGKAASHWAWYIAQHSDHNLSFQEKCLSLMQALPKKEISLYNFSYLTDRIKVAKRLPQVYGTQFQWKKRKKNYPRIENPKDLAKRRTEVGLDEPFQSYHERMTGVRL